MPGSPRSVRRGLSAVPLAAGLFAAACVAAPADAGVQPTAGVEPDALRCIALAVYFEAKGEPEDGQAAVAHVVLNRAASGKFPDQPCAVVFQRNAAGCQFSWTCDGKPDTPREPEAWARAMTVAERAVTGDLPDPTEGALFFHGRKSAPAWRHEMTRVADIGGHTFYR